MGPGCMGGEEGMNQAENCSPTFTPLPVHEAKHTAGSMGAAGVGKQL